MIDEREINKGGFGAFAAMDRERQLAREAAAQNGTGKPAPKPPADATSTDGGALPGAPRVEKSK